MRISTQQYWSFITNIIHSLVYLRKLKNRWKQFHDCFSHWYNDSSFKQRKHTLSQQLFQQMSPKSSCKCGFDQNLFTGLKKTKNYDSLWVICSVKHDYKYKVFCPNEYIRQWLFSNIPNVNALDVCCSLVTCSFSLLSRMAWSVHI